MDYQSGNIAVVLIELGLSVASLVAMWIAVVRILHRTGYSGWWSLMMMVPLANAVVLWIYSRADWPMARGGRTAAPARTTVQAPQRPAPRTPVSRPAPVTDPQQDNVF